MKYPFATFNELSCPSGIYSRLELRRQLIDLASVYHRAWELGLKKVRAHESFNSIATVEGESIFDVIRSLPLRDQRILLSATDAPHVRDEDGDEVVDRYIVHEIVAVNDREVTSADGFLCAYLNGTVALSVPSDSRWDGDFVRMSLREGRANSEKNVTVAHASGCGSLERHLVTIGTLCFEHVKLPCTKVDPLRNSVYVTKHLVNGNWQEAYRRFAVVSYYRLPIIEEFAAKVALLNGYLFEPELSRLNQRVFDSKRQIFSSLNPKKEIFLSTDFEKGAFEVCDKAGIHLGEWLFSGVKNQGPDKSGAHDIRLE